MNLNISQMVSAYESSPGGKETVEGLARFFEVDVAILTEILRVHSLVFKDKQLLLKNEIGNENKDGTIEHPAEDVDDETFKAIKQSVINTALGSRDERLALKAGMFLWNEKKGRNDRKMDVPIANVNIQILNARFEKLREMRQLGKGNSQSNVTTVVEV